MSDTPEWRKALRDSNAIGWIGFFVLVLAIGVGSIYFGIGSEPEKPASVSQATQ